MAGVRAFTEQSTKRAALRSAAGLLDAPLGRVTKSMWLEYLSSGRLCFSSKCGARMFLARTVTL